ncbi:MAG: cysteine desulfurase [Bacteroidetes bacterium]|nr:cysteine desulfurase [Bacteroidota bacterium]MBU1579254.1 cysteine desulfurase [Bacteroidota bacterium]MBU2465032.1 cysteine desulfurase [Bacteroidota bacterium]MBU2558410.1 cysteine desulfurase [Bacteroidota bacterium]
MKPFADNEIAEIRSHFPALHQKVYGKPFVYLDNAATTQKPQAVIDRLVAYYSLENSNIHRGVHYLSQQATQAYEDARQTVADFINASAANQIIFTKGTTESVNLLAGSLRQFYLLEGDAVLITGMEHHSNLVPWQQVCKQNQAELLVAALNDKGETDLDHFAELLDKKPKLAAITHISNALGSVNPVKEMIRMAHEKGVPVLVDGAQAVAHTSIDVQELDCDFFVFSGHKMFGPMGIGVLYAKAFWLQKMPPWQFGGEMVDQVSFEETTFNQLPFKFEAGTPNVAGVLGLKTAIDFLKQYDMEVIAKHENQLMQQALEKLLTIPGMRLIGEAENRAGVISFVVDGTHPSDIGTLVDKMGVAVRTGHHCAQPVMTRFDVPGTVRASFALYNSLADVEGLFQAVKKAVMMLR